MFKKQHMFKIHVFENHHVCKTRHWFVNVRGYVFLGYLMSSYDAKVWDLFGAKRFFVKLLETGPHIVDQI